MKLSKYLFETSYQKNGKTIYLIFSGRTAKSIKISSKVHTALHQKQFSTLPKRILKILVEAKVIVPFDENEFKTVSKENEYEIERQSNLDKEHLYLSIQPTAFCQLACDYCGQEHQRYNILGNTMRLVINRVKQKIDEYHYKTFEMGWFGGEPLCAMKEMRKLNEAIKKIVSYKGIQYSSHITTNGLALTLPLYKELKDQFCCHNIEITLDGSKEFHDKHRFTISKKGSFETIYRHLKEILVSPIYDKDACSISVRCNVDEQNMEGIIPLMEKINEDKLQDRISFYTTCIISWAQNGAGKEEIWKKVGKKTTQYILYMIEHQFQVNILPTRSFPMKCIGTSCNSEMYDAYGNIFDCSETSYSSVYKNTQFILGNIHDSPTLDLPRSTLQKIPLKLTTGKVESCYNCKFYPLCGGACPLALSEKEPRCPSFIYNMEERILLSMIQQNINNSITRYD